MAVDRIAVQARADTPSLRYAWRRTDGRAYGDNGAWTKKQHFHIVNWTSSIGVQDRGYSRTRPLDKPILPVKPHTFRRGTS